MGKNGVDNDEFTYGSPENIETRGGEKDWVPERRRYSRESKRESSLSGRLKF